MKKLLAIFLSVLLTCGLAACGGGGGGGGSELSLISCPEQGFTTKTDPSYTWETDEVEGLIIYMEDKGSMPYVRVSWIDDIDSVDDARDYMSETLRPALKDANPGGPFAASETSEENIGGKKLPTAEYIYNEQGQQVTMKLAFDTTGDHTVVYQAKYLSDEGEEALDALKNAIRNFKEGDKPKTANANPDLLGGISAGKTSGSRDSNNEDDRIADTDDEEETGLRPIYSTKSGFTTMADSSYPLRYNDDGSINIWTGTENYIPYVLIWEAEGNDPDPFVQIKNHWTPKMEEEWGDDLESVTEYRNYEIAGKKVVAALYAFRIDGRLVEDLLIRDGTGERMVEYHARYHPKRECKDWEEQEEETTMAALETAISNFKTGDGSQMNDESSNSSSGGDRSESKTGSSKTGGNNKATSNGNLKIIPAESKKVQYEKYSDGLISMDIPKGWKVIPEPGSMDAVHYTFQVVNPKNRDYQIFFSMKCEAGNLSSEKERQWYASTYPDSPFAIMPAIDPQTTEGFFRVFSQIVSLSGGNIRGDFVYPAFNDFNVIEKIGTVPLLGGDIIHASFNNDKGNPVEGIFTSSPYLVSLYYVNTVILYNISYITAPADDFVNWQPVLDHCLGSITFSDTFTSNFMSQEQTIAASNAEIARICGETSDIITQGWEARQSTYDIISQKQNDATLGYERVYDTETGEIYKAYNGFTDDISTDNYFSERYQPITDDMYLSGIDGYIEK